LRVLSVQEDVFSQLVQSRTRLRILDLLSRRGRTLRELSSLTGISVQGVLRHLEDMKKLGLVEEKKIKAKKLSARRIYLLTGLHVNDFSLNDLAVIRAGSPSRSSGNPRLTFEQLEDTSAEILVRRRAIKQQVKRLAKMIEEVSEEEAGLVQAIETMGLDDEDRVVLETAFTEDTLEEAEELLRRTQGVSDASETIEKAMNKARRIAKK